jgi:hypothetical protein
VLICALLFGLMFVGLLTVLSPADSPHRQWINSIQGPYDRAQACPEPRIAPHDMEQLARELRTAVQEDTRRANDVLLEAVAALESRINELVVMSERRVNNVPPEVPVEPEEPEVPDWKTLHPATPHAPKTTPAPAEEPYTYTYDDNRDDSDNRDDDRDSDYDVS